MDDVINSLRKLQVVETVEDLLTDDEDDDSNISDDTCDNSNETEPSEFLNFATFYKETYSDLSLVSLKKICSQIDIKITDSEAAEIEKSTQDQVNSSQWHELRRGRITASIFKSVCCTRIEKPSISLLTRICYPEEAAFTSKYTEWGRKHEKQALHELVTRIKALHVNFKYCNSGLIIHPQYPYFGASPDGLCSCECCGKGCIEIKCPYTLKYGESFEILTEKVNPFLTRVNGKYDVAKNHAYYFQIQMQLFLSGRSYCYFVVWNPKDMLIIKILPDKKFWLQHSAKAETFFKSVVMPELVGKYFTKQKTGICK